jgi:hypothetical protein
VDALHLHPVDLEPDDPAPRLDAGRCGERRSAYVTLLVQADQSAESQLEWRVGVRGNQCRAAAVKVHVDEQKARLDSCDVERQHSGRPEAEVLSRADECVPDPQRMLGGNPDFVAEVAGVPGAGNIHRHSRDASSGHAEVLESIDVRFGDLAEQ